MKCEELGINDVIQIRDYKYIIKENDIKNKRLKVKSNRNDCSFTISYKIIYGDPTHWRYMGNLYPLWIRLLSFNRYYWRLQLVVGIILKERQNEKYSISYKHFFSI